LIESPYRTPQSLVGGPRADAALMSISGRTSSTKAMGKGSTQFQHMVQTEVPPKLLEGWLDLWRKQCDYKGKLKVSLRPHTAGSDLLELAIHSSGGDKLVNVVFANIEDRRGRRILSVRDQNNFDVNLRKKRLMTLVHLFLIHRYRVDYIHYLTPTDDNQRQAARMKERGIYRSVHNEVGEIIVADVNPARIRELLSPDHVVLEALIARG
jgi:isocitrate lyase